MVEERHGGTQAPRHEGGVFIGLGSNVGDRQGHIRTSLRELSEHENVELLRCSSVHETAPVGGPSGQEMYLNAAAEIATSLPPQDLLAWLHEIERRHGRVRQTRWGPRTLDLDLLLYRDFFIDRLELSVPHPRMWKRDFVMTPLREICGDDAIESYRRHFADKAVLNERQSDHIRTGSAYSG